VPEIKCYSEIEVRKLVEEGYEWAIRGEIKADFLLERRKATAEWLFFNDGQSLASQGFSGSARLRDEKTPVAAGPGGT
jgi:hypothetical protein